MVKVLTKILEEVKFIQDKGIVFVKNEAEDKKLSYSDIYEKASQVLAFLQTGGIEPGMEAIFQMDTEEDFIIMYWGCILGGIVPVPLNLATNYEQYMQLLRVWNILDQPFFLGSEIAMKRLHNFFKGQTNADEFEEIKSKTVIYNDYNKEKYEVPVIYQTKPDDLLTLLFSSGSTGDPKAVMITHKNLSVNINSLNERWNIDSEHDCSLSWMPLTHVMGLVLSHFASTVAQINQVIMPPSLFVANPVLWLKKSAEYQATILSSPNFGMKLFNSEMEHYQGDIYDLSKVRIICNAAEPISIEVCNQFLDNMEPYHLKRNTIVPFFGMTEATISITAVEAGEPVNAISVDRRHLQIGEPIVPVGYHDANAITFVNLGSPFSCCEVRIADTNNVVMEDDIIGYIQVKGEAVTQGYYNNPEATKAAISDDKWLTTGDLGFLNNKQLVVTGRVKDIIFVNGQNFYPHDIEKIAGNATGVNGRKVVVTALNQDTKSEEVGVFVDYHDDLEEFIPIITSIKEEINEKMRLEVYDVVPITNIPKTGSGKIRRYQLSQMYNEGVFTSTLHKINSILINQITGKKSDNFKPENEDERRVRQIFEAVLNRKGVDIGTSIFRYGVNSLSMMKIIDIIQRDFSINLDINDLFEYKTIHDLVAWIRQQEKQQELRHALRETDVEHIDQPFPLTDIQTAYLLGRNESYDLGGISTHVYIELKTELKIDRLNRALVKVVQKHDMMRAIFENDQQRILATVPEYKIVVTDITNLEPSMAETFLLKEREKMSHSVFPVDVWPLFEVKAIKYKQDRHYLLIGLDMLIIDALSLEIIAQDLKKYYEDEELAVEELGFSFRDYILAYKELKNSQLYERDKAYWMEKLDCFPEAPNLPVIGDVASVKNVRFERIYQLIDKETRGRLKKVAGKHNVTESAILCTVYLEILSSRSNQSELAINLTVINRYPFHRDIDRLVGDFTAVMALGVNFEGIDDFWNKVKAVQKIMMAGIAHRHYDGVEFIRELSKDGKRQNKALIPVVFTSSLTNEMWGKWNGLGEINYIITQTSQVYLDFQASEMDGQLLLNWDYIVDLFDKEMIQNMFSQYLDIIDAICDERPLHKLRVSAEDREVIVQYNNTDERIEPSLLHELFELQVIQNPDQTAIIEGERSMTYLELNKRSNQIARKLKESGLEREQPVGVYAARCIESIANIMGILKAGGVYVPIDPIYPKDRIDYILENSGCRQMINTDFYDLHQLLEYSNTNLSINIDPKDLAYIIYTSGSTGTPKGVVISHQAAANTIIDINQKFNVNNTDKILGISSMCFDLSVYDIFGSLAAGATLIMVPDQRDVKYMYQMIQRHQVTIWNSVPAIMDLMTQYIQDEMEHLKEDTAESDQGNAIYMSTGAVSENAIPVKYYWSPAVSWNDEDRIDEYLMIDSAMEQLFPQFYFYLMKGASFQEILTRFNEVPKEDLEIFLKQLIKNKILIRTINNPHEIFKSQEVLYDNRYPEEIKYNPDLYEKFKHEQLNRNYQFASREVISLLNNEKYPDYLENRVTHRTFNENKVISFGHFSYLISCCKQRLKNNKIQYYYPSAGGLYPIDLYLYIKKDRIEGVKGGIYYYNPVHNSISLVNDKFQVTDDLQLYTNKAIFNSSAFTVYFVYNADSTMPKYGGSGYLYACIDTGIIVGIITGIAETLNLGTCSIGEMNEEPLENAFQWNKNQKLIHSLEIGLKEGNLENDEVSLLPADTTVETQQSNPSRLRVVMLSGDWIPLSLPPKVKKIYPNAKVVSLGGATEASIWSIYYPIEEQMEGWKSIPYGIPLANQRIYILDYQQELCHIGTPGEIHIGGVGVAEGYRNDKTKTDSAFFNHPEFGRLYKTGDFGVMTANGYVEFLGRRDQQVKIRGYRIELGEIENQMQDFESVTNVAVIDFDDSDGKKYLCAYIVSAQKINPADIKEHLKEKLPDYMIPSFIMQIESIPYSANGKVNKKALPQPDLGKIERQLIQPTSEMEQRVLELWKEVLKTKEISITDNFFDIGGNSMLLLNVYSKIDRMFPKVMKITDLFTRTSVIKIAEFLSMKIDPKAKVKIDAVKLKPDYFTEPGTKASNHILSFTLDKDMIGKINSLAEIKNLSMSQVLGAYFLYLLNQISGQTKINLQICSERQNQINSVRADFTKMEDFDELFAKVSNVSLQDHYLLKELPAIDMKRDKDAVIPLFVMKDFITEQVNLLEYFDLIFMVKPAGETLIFECEYNCSKIKTAKAKETISDYLQLLNYFVNNDSEKTEG